MLVTRIEPVKGRRYRIYLNDEKAFLLYGTDLSEYGIEEGEEISESLLGEIYSAVLVKRARLRCMHILKDMDKTEWQLRQKLAEGEYPAEIIDNAIDYVKGYHYVDDLRYCINYISGRRESKSRQQMKAALMTKGVKSEVIEEAFEEADPIDESAQILRWAEKKHFDYAEADPDSRRKFVQFLQRKGFGYSQIIKALT